MNLNEIGIVGYGEVGKTFAIGLTAKPGVSTMAAWDLKFSDAATRDAELAHAKAHGIRAAASAADLCAQASLVISAVTASNTLAVAQQVAAHIRAGSVFLDLNSASPGTKQQAAVLIEAAGAHSVEAGGRTSV